MPVQNKRDIRVEYGDGVKYLEASGIRIVTAL